MGIKRDKQSGRLDSLGRQIKVSGIIPKRTHGSKVDGSPEEDFTNVKESKPFDINDHFTEVNDYESAAVCDILGLVKNFPHID